MQYWMVGNHVRGLVRQVLTSKQYQEMGRVGNRLMESPQEAREMEDVGVRLRSMDSLGIDVQVLYSTIFIMMVSDRVDEETAICKGWNRWLADIWAQGNGRLRWTCCLPVLSDLPTAIEELRWCKDHGAVGVFMRPIEGNHTLFDPYFYPLYEKISELNMMIGLHVANANPQMHELVSQYHTAGGFYLRLATVGAFHALICSEVPTLFPNLRWGFIEASADWVPYAIKHIVRQFNQRGQEVPPNPMKLWNTYVTVQADDDVSYILNYAGEDNFVVGTDYGHNDPSTELNALQILRERTGISAEQYNKIVDDNARALYAL
jgi:predicted TIM-barrel fold metal-dependent hydrolase